jgi:molybdopterin/thiamine biosynthesis adenylyltransferase
VRPHLKTSFPRFSGSGVVHFRRSGELLTLEDPHGSVATLLDLLDGSRTPEQIADEMAGLAPGIAREAVLEAVVELDRSGLLEDGSVQQVLFTDAELDRFVNNFGFFESFSSLATSKYELQNRLRHMRVALLGVGGVGSHLLLDLVAVGIEDIRIVDFDTVQLSNLNRQILYVEADLGKPKVEQARERALAMRPACSIDARQRRLSSPDDVYDMVSDRDVVFAAVDRPKTTILHWLNAGCVRAGVPLVTGGVDRTRIFHYTIVPGVTGCFECWYQKAERHDVATRLVVRSLQQEAAHGLPAGEDSAAFDGLVALHASLLLCELVRLATRVQVPLSLGRSMELTFCEPLLTESERWTRDPTCLICASIQPHPKFAWLRGQQPAEMTGQHE